jgi:serine/threonine protein kinase
VKVCPLCNRTYGSGTEVCEHDGTRLVAIRREDPTEAAPIIDWDGPMAGDLVGSYRLESMIAEGGMGRIFRATHLTLGRKVAIKFLLAEHASRADLVQRFFNEARSVNSIQHPHILEIYDFVQDRPPGGQAKVYMVMELLEGEDLRTRLARRKVLSPEAAVRIGAPVAEALAAAHERNILHRDLKPDNIFLCKQPPDFVKLLDFGAAKAFGERPGADLTRPGVAIGTPEYMAPEQILATDADGRVDQYALGIVLYELLTGDVPFNAANIGDVLAMQTKQAPPLIAYRRAVAPPVPEALERVVMRCLAKKPDQRFPSLWEVARALRDSLTEGAVLEGIDEELTTERPSHRPIRKKVSNATKPLTSLRDTGLRGGALGPKLGTGEKSDADLSQASDLSTSVERPPARAKGARAAALDALLPEPVSAPAPSMDDDDFEQQTHVDEAFAADFTPGYDPIDDQDLDDDEDALATNPDAMRAVGQTPSPNVDELDGPTATTSRSPADRTGPRRSVALDQYAEPAPEVDADEPPTVRLGRSPKTAETARDDRLLDLMSTASSLATQTSETTLDRDDELRELMPSADPRSGPPIWLFLAIGGVVVLSLLLVLVLVLL